MKTMDEKFFMNQILNKYEVKSLYIEKIKHFTFLKNLVVNSADMKSGLVDVSMLKSFVDQINMKMQIFKSLNEEKMESEKKEDEFF